MMKYIKSQTPGSKLPTNLKFIWDLLFGIFGYWDQNLAEAAKEEIML
jgi:hypothetical protein